MKRITLDSETYADVRPSPSTNGYRLDVLVWQSDHAARELLTQLALNYGVLDVRLAAEDTRRADFEDLGFEEYAHTVTLRCQFEAAWPEPDLLEGLDLLPYQTAWADAFIQAEAAAMAGDPMFRMMGSPSGFEQSPGRLFLVIRRKADGAILAFSHAERYEDKQGLSGGWINWFGVVPEARGLGLGRALLARTANVLLGEVHLGALIPVRFLETETSVGTDAHRFWNHMGFDDGPQVVYLAWSAS